MHYTLNNGQYALIDKNKNVVSHFDRVGILFDAKTGTLFRHGEAGVIRVHYLKSLALIEEALSSKRLLKPEAQNFVNNLSFIEGGFEIEPLNSMIDSRDYLLSWVKNSQEEQLLKLNEARQHIIASTEIPGRDIGTVVKVDVALLQGEILFLNEHGFYPCNLPAADSPQQALWILESHPNSRAKNIACKTSLSPQAFK